MQIAAVNKKSNILINLPICDWNLSRFHNEEELKTSSLREKSLYSWATSKFQISTIEKTFFRSKGFLEMLQFVMFWLIHYIFGTKCSILVKFVQKIENTSNLSIINFECFQTCRKNVNKLEKLRKNEQKRFYYMEFLVITRGISEDDSILYSVWIIVRFSWPNWYKQKLWNHANKHMLPQISTILNDISGKLQNLASIRIYRYYTFPRSYSNFFFGFSIIFRESYSELLLEVVIFSVQVTINTFLRKRKFLLNQDFYLNKRHNSNFLSNSNIFRTVHAILSRNWSSKNSETLCRSYTNVSSFEWSIFV
jgi:hypothetical protein